MVRYEGVLLVDKPYGITSHDVVDELRKILQISKIGHTGTLDPRATGLLVICLGRATKIAQFLTDDDKTYEAQIKLGEKSTTYDSEGIIKSDEPAAVPNLNDAEIELVLNEFKGKVTQKTPEFSAIKIGGERLYKLARKGKKPETPEREIEIKDIRLVKSNLPRIDFEVTCSKGTYIRSLANDIGERIGCGAYLSRLHRTRAGRFELKSALTLKEIGHYRDAGILKRFLIPIEKALTFPVIKVSEDFTPTIITGNSPKPNDIVEIEGKFGQGAQVSVKDWQGKLMAIGISSVASEEIPEYQGRGFFKYVRVLN